MRIHKVGRKDAPAPAQDVISENYWDLSLDLLSPIRLFLLEAVSLISKFSNMQAIDSLSPLDHFI